MCWALFSISKYQVIYIKFNVKILSYLILLLSQCYYQETEEQRTQIKRLSDVTLETRLFTSFDTASQRNGLLVGTEHFLAGVETESPEHLCPG